MFQTIDFQKPFAWSMSLYLFLIFHSYNGFLYCYWHNSGPEKFVDKCQYQTPKAIKSLDTESFLIPALRND